MVQRLGSIKKWRLVEIDEVVAFDSPKPRLVRIEVNAPASAELYYIDGDGAVSFLGLVRGRDTIESSSDGKFSLAVQAGDCWVYSVDGDDISTTIIDPIIFTRVVERRRRSPELVEMELSMMANVNKRMEQMQRELSRGVLLRERAVEAQLAAARRLATDPAESESDDPEGDASDNDTSGSD
jgi:hypothetical protein